MFPPPPHFLFLSGLRVEGPSQSIIDVPVKNLTDDGYCNFPCSFNTENDEVSEQQPCLYTVRVGEVFKGNYTVREKRSKLGIIYEAILGSFATSNLLMCDIL